MKKNFLNRSSLIFLVFLSVFILFAACSKQESEEPKESKAAEPVLDLTITQGDIMLLIQHKKKIDGITAEYDKKIAEVPPSAAYKLIEEGKGEINKYLESNGLNPEVFMKKSKRILRAYLAFVETSGETMQKRIEILKKNDASPNEIEMKKNAYKKAGESFFKEMTDGLSPKEIELVKSNLKNIATVTE